MLNKNSRLLSLFALLVLVAVVFCALPAMSQNPSVTIRSNYVLGYPVQNTSIYLDGQLIGTTDANGVYLLTSYAPGTHNITAINDEYESSTREVDLGQTAEVILRLQDKVLEVPAEAMIIYVRENTDAKNWVAGADIYIDGTLAGETNNYGRFWTTQYTGDHQVKVLKKGSYEMTSTITFVPGGNYTFMLDREPKKFSIFDSELFSYSLGKEITMGLVATLKLSIIAFAVGIFLGLVMGLGRVSKNLIARYASSIYVEGVRGLPLVLQILFIYYGLPFFMKDLFGISLIIDGYEFYAAVIALSMNSGAYMGEIFKAGIEAIHKGQMEAARSVGMSYWQAMFYVILPQAFKIVLPALGNEFIALIKDSSIALVISYQEVTYWAKSLGYEHYNAFTPLVAAGCVYLIITIPLGKLVQYIEKRYSVNSPRKDSAGWLGKRRKPGGKPEGSA
jgi:polar amino acid transport system permease protein